MVKIPRTVAIAAALALALSACGGKDQAQPGGGMPPPEVGVVTLQPRHPLIPRIGLGVLAALGAAAVWFEPEAKRQVLVLSAGIVVAIASLASSGIRMGLAAGMRVGHQPCHWLEVGFHRGARIHQYHRGAGVVEA